MASQLQIDQATLSPTGTPGRARTDGLAGGQLVTLTNTGSGSTTLFRFLDIPPGDTTAVASLAATGNPKIWTFSPTASVYGSYLIELIEDVGLPTEVKERRVFGIRTPRLNLLIPALNEQGDRTASLINAGAAQIEAADNNADDHPDADLGARTYAAWWRWVAEITRALELDSLSPAEFQLTIGGGGGEVPSPWVDFDLAAACPGIKAGDIVSLILHSDLEIDSIIPPSGGGFSCKIGVRDVTSTYQLTILDSTVAVGTVANTFRTPGAQTGETPPVFELAASGCEEAWTEIGYTEISSSWRIFERSSLFSGGGTAGGIQRFDLTHSPVALYHFDGTLNDSSGNNLHIDSGTPTYREIFPNFIGLSSTQPLLQRSIHDPLLTITGAVTVECLAVLTGTGSFVVAAFTATGETEATNILWQLDSPTGDGLRNFWEFGAGTNGGTGEILGNRVLPRLHVPCHLAITRASDGVSRAYVNGVQLGSTTSALTLPTGGSTSNLQIAAASNIAKFGLKVIAAELTPGEIAAEYNRTLGPAYGFLV